MFHRHVNQVMGIVLILGGCSANSPEQPQTPGKEPPFQSPDGRFSVRFPGVPEHHTETFEKEDEQIIKHRFSVFRDNKREIYMVIYLDFPEPTFKEHGPKKLLDLFAEGIVADAKGTMREKRAITLDGNAGWEVKADVPKTSLMTARIFLIGNRCYHVIAGMPRTNASFDEAIAFLDSFKILK